jgi:hypothetical protein
MIEGASRFWVLLEVTKSGRQLHGKGRTNVVPLDLPRERAWDGSLGANCVRGSFERLSFHVPSL